MGSRIKFKLSKHAEQEMDRRRIPPALLQQVLSRPDQVVPMLGGLKAYQSKIDFGGGKNYLVRVIVAEDANPPIVVTVYRTSKISKYWRGI
jgi:hypothetical protein